MILYKLLCKFGYHKWEEFGISNSIDKVYTCNRCGDIGFSISMSEISSINNPKTKRIAKNKHYGNKKRR